MSPKSQQLRDTYVNCRNKSKGLGHFNPNNTRALSKVDLHCHSQQNMMSKSSNKTISELLAGESNHRLNTQRASQPNSIKICKNSAVKQMVSALAYHVNIIQYPCFERLKKFPGFTVESSDDSLVKLD